MSTPEKPADDGSFVRDVSTHTGKALGLIVIAVLVAVLLLHHEGGSTVATSTKTTVRVPVPTTSPVPTTAPPTTVPPGQVTLIVLNGTLSGDLASQFSAKLKKSPGYDTTIADNTTSAVTSSSVIAVKPQYLGNAMALATSLGLPATDAVNGVPANSPIHTSEQTMADLILIVGPNLANQA